MSMFTLAISCMTTSNFALIHGPDIPGSYAILFFTASDLASITSHIHNWVLLLLWLHLFILSRVISPLISSSRLGTYRPGEFIFLPLGFSVHAIFQARILEWVAMPSSRGSSQHRDRTWVSWIACTAAYSLLLSHRGSPLWQHGALPNAKLEWQWVAKRRDFSSFLLWLIL